VSNVEKVPGKLPKKRKTTEREENQLVGEHDGKHICRLNFGAVWHVSVVKKKKELTVSKVRGEKRHTKKEPKA
jgi:hypothetical protein